MKAETVYNVIQALNSDEKLRLYAMLDLHKVSAKRIKRKKQKLISVASAMDDLLAKTFNK
ncbi:hypothetical protein H2O64_14350 [Kordia sp. YSTF-M3]|uniref:50S ribosomal protein L29 n=1 Tax=Kordia aestuariivivens TaxID=2759037 RepID=A0ABR7QBC7_9FLAO|nr:hypothetical protein [Kordia aestuariivivens]MBC8755855.1 hypothetical protein [Kordia aestuariivivens]